MSGLNKVWDQKWSVTTPSIVGATFLKYDCKLHGREGWDSHSLSLKNTLSNYHLTEKVPLSYTINYQMVTPSHT